MMTEDSLLALAATAAAVDAAAELARFAREGSALSEGGLAEDCIERLLDAAKMAIDVERHDCPIDDEREQVYAALCRYLEGWAP